MIIMVTGATGFLGHNIIPVLNREFKGHTVWPVSRFDADLRDPIRCDRLFSMTKPQVVLNLAGLVGGIIANRDKPVDFCQDTLRITSNVFESAQRNGIRKLITIVGGCSYPANAPVPIAESSMWEGLPAPEAAPFSLAKRMTMVLSESYRKQYGLNSIVLVPGNGYGPYDNFSLTESHVIPAIIRKMYEAKKDGIPVRLFGSGRPQRDFIYAPDLARMMPYFINHYDSSDIVNLSTGVGTSIKEIADLVAKYMDFKEEVIWNTKMPEGHQIKIFDVQKMMSLDGLSKPTTSINTGIRETVNWFLENIQNNGVRL
jgi:GDP-L-fucose synthase